jgi:outer membrane protein insertion porin family
MIKKIRIGFLFFAMLLAIVDVMAQKSVSDISLKMDYSKPVSYEVGGITVSGAKYSDANAIILFSGIKVGDKIELPGDKRIKTAIKNLWKQRLFSGVSVRIGEIRGNTVFLNIEVVERPRMSRFQFKGISKSDADNLRESLQLIRGTIVNDNLISNTKNKIRAYYKDKGYYNVKVNIIEQPEPNVQNSVILIIDVARGKKVKIEKVLIVGAEKIPAKKVKSAMKDTRENSIINIFKSSKFTNLNFKEDKVNVINLYNKNGYRDAKIVSDTIYESHEDRLTVQLSISEGKQYFFGDITFVGNTKYNSRLLSNFLDIEKGEVFNREKFEKRLRMDPNGGDISSLYMDDGYLTFTPIPVETGVRNDTIDMEIRIYEGMQFRIGKVIIKGNTKTNEYVIRREIRTKPGKLFSREDIIRTQRELSQLGYFNPEAFGINPIQHPETGTVDIEYTVEEKPSDQIELSGGYGAGTIIGTVGLRFTNFSLNKFFDFGAWRPVPSGDGQQVSLRVQSNGRFFQAYSFSFTEPWLGGRKPNSLTVGLSYQRFLQPGFDGQDGTLGISTASVGLGKRLTWPDDYFQLFQAISIQEYSLNNYAGLGAFGFTNGDSRNFSYSITLSRNSINQPLYPTWGSEFRISLKLTPPYSLLDGKENPQDLPPELKYKYVEYHKWKIVMNWYTELFPKLVLRIGAGFGYLGYYNDEIGTPPFERFYMGGSGLTGVSYDGREVIAMRGYNDNSLSPAEGSSAVAKYTMELRYPLTLSQMTTIYALTFFEAGKTWVGPSYQINPSNLYRAAGVGLRIFLPAFGMLGLDYGWRLDDVPGYPGMDQGQFHFSIGMNLGEL